MKGKSFLIIVIALSVTVTVGMWAYYSIEGTINIMEFGQFAIIGLLIIFALFIGLRRFKSERAGQPAEDEMSKKIMQRSASISFYLSIYMWLILSYFSDTLDLETSSLIGLGILCMAILFALSWVYYQFLGIKE